ncbi:EcoRII-like protein [Luteimonas sp. J16]|jgi:hypothetical protein|uniref:type II restriction endonuclease n=1 Tax=unclassified Luteimonas TaxID=2629088 RepID=UPI0006842B88|nr:MULTISPECIES: type II restriction endonuclease [unclassified Luteimonas]TWG89482.1 EcoRII-like protein [Luteimonas sp. J16]
MREQFELDLGSSRIAETTADGSPLWWKVQSLAAESDRLFVKKLSRNDTSWADDPRKRQAGFYIPRPVRDAGFFPPLEADNPAKPHIFHAVIQVLWPQTGEVTTSHLRHFSNKGPEAHCTRVPRVLFSELTPASFLMAGRFARPLAGCRWWMAVLDSAGEEAEILETVFDLPVDFRYGLFHAHAISAARRADQDELEELIEEFRAAMRTGTLADVVSRYAVMPDPAVIARQAREQWLRAEGLAAFDPWRIAAPGDAIMKISREIEYRLYKGHEVRRRASELLALLANQGDLPSAVVRRYPEIDAVLLSASQQRKTRAGRSFEQHIAAALDAGQVRFQEQAVTGGRRPDFVMPDLRTLRSNRRSQEGALVLAAKTTLRERWKQVFSERLNCEVYLATIDDRVAPNAISEMADKSIRIVVPESLRNSPEAFYKGQSNVLTFREFFDSEIRGRRPQLIRQR